VGAVKRRVVWLPSLRFALILVVILATTAPHAATAAPESGWIESGDTVLRIDLALLNDAGVIRLPVTQWPMPRAALEWAMRDAKDHLAVNAAVADALARTRTRVSARPSTVMLEAGAIAGRAGLLRDFDAFGREDAEIFGRGTYSSGRFSAALKIAGVLKPADGQELRADGSHATLALGNWLLSAQTLDRFWGPSHESSLILSNNARPMPTFVVERAVPRPFESRWLDWLGPWRFSFGVGRMESERSDIDSPLFMSWRVTIMPFKDIEVGFSRTAQFCGRQQICTGSSFVDLLIGNDNPGFDATLETEPGNQMAGFDIRWASPLGELPYAVYGQMIGEDESSYLPVKYLSQFGAEVWKPLPDGALVMGFLEYADTTCSSNRSPPIFNCAYTQQNLFNVEGYRYRNRVVGHTLDSDAEVYSLGATLTSRGGDLWSITARSGELNRDAGVDLNNTVSTSRAIYRGLDLGWRGNLLGSPVSVDLGADYRRPEGADREIEVHGFVGWRYEFDE
jgi:hypothetical protein